MARYDRITPDGTRDLLFEECLRREQVISRVCGIVRSRGYEQVITPTLEFYDVYSRAADYLPQETMYKLTDGRGRLMVLCPDGTVPIARLAATRLSEETMPLRIWYQHRTYRMLPDLKAKRTEIDQIGIELIGASSLMSDLEAVDLAAQALESVQENYRLELCHIGFFHAVMDRLEAPADVKEEIRLCIEQKNYAALSDLLEPYAGQQAASALHRLPRLFGGPDVLEQARGLIDDEAAHRSLDKLERIYSMLCELGLSSKILLDLSLVNLADYYTGIIFKGYLDGIGTDVLSGGRYDRLLSDFGVPMPAIGFAFDADLASQAAPAVGRPGPDAVVYAVSEEAASAAASEARRLQREGLTVILGTQETEAEALAFAKAVGAGRFIPVWEEKA